MNKVYNYNLVPKRGEIILAELKLSKTATIKYLLLILVGFPLLLLFFVGVIPILVGIYYLMKTLDHIDQDQYVITNTRIHVLTGGEHEKIALEIDLESILSIGIRKEILGSILNRGILEIHGQKKELSFGPIADPENVKELIEEAMQKRSETGAGVP